MAGHSKWANIKRRKAAVDAKRGKLFTRLLKEIQVAAKIGGGNPEANPRLKVAIATARAQSVPNDNIERSIKRGTGDLEGVDYEEITYEGYGPGGVALLISVLTDNRVRTVAEIRHILTRSQGSLGATNSVAYLFKEKGVFSLARDLISEERLMELALEAGADDVRDEGGIWQLESDPANFARVRDTIEELKLEFEGSVVPIPETTVRIEGADVDRLLKLLDALDDLDDVQNVFANFEIDEKDLERAGA